MECKKQEGLSKMSVTVNIKTKEIIALEVTDEKVHGWKGYEAID